MRLPSLLALVLVTVAAAVGRTQDAPPGGKYALLIGVRQYDQREIRSLRYPDRDVTALAAVLRKQGYDQVVVLTQAEKGVDSAATPLADTVRKQIKRLVEDRKAEDTVLLAFVGQGVQFRGDKEFCLCPADGSLAGTERLIPLTEVYRSLQASKAGIKVVLLDAFRDDPRPAGRLPGVEWDNAVKLPPPPGGVATLLGCAPGQVSRESPNLRHGLFCHYLIKGLEGKAANERGVVTLAGLAEYVGREVDEHARIELKTAQTPQLAAKLGGEAVLAVVSTADAALAASSIVKLQTNHGTIVIELFPSKAPITVKNFLGYVDSRFYDGTIFHRVIPNFMIQGGGFQPGLTEKKTEPPIKNEAGNGLSNTRGTVAMARTVEPDSATAQFYINLKDNRFLDFNQDGPQRAGYAVFGRVVEGMDVVDRIAGVATGARGGHQNVPVQDVVILSARRALAR